MNKRGQVTIFIILGIIILVIVGVTLLVYKSYYKEKTTPEVAEKFISSQIEPIKNHVKDCFKKTVKNGIDIISIQGGYLNPIKFVQLGDYKVSYAYYKDTSGANVNRLPSIEQLKREIEVYSKTSDTEKELDECIDDFKTFKKQGLNIKANSRNIKVNDITLNSIIFTIDYPITISKGDYSTTIKEISFTMPSNLGTAHKVATDIVNDEIVNKEFNIDSYISDNPPIIRIERQRENNNLFYYLTTIPQKEEEPIKFHFVIEK